MDGEGGGGGFSGVPAMIDRGGRHPPSLRRMARDRAEFLTRAIFGARGEIEVHGILEETRMGSVEFRGVHPKTPNMPDSSWELCTGSGAAEIVSIEALFFMMEQSVMRDYALRWGLREGEAMRTGVSGYGVMVETYICSELLPGATSIAFYSELFWAGSPTN